MTAMILNPASALWPTQTIPQRWQAWLDRLPFAKQPSGEEDDMDEAAEEGRSDSDAAPSERRGAPRPPSKKGDDVSDAPESGTRETDD